MIRIRKVGNPYLAANSRKLERVGEIIRAQFPAIAPARIAEIREQMVNPLKFRYQGLLFLAEDINDTVRGFALLLYMPDLNFCFLDYIAVSPGRTSSGIGGALYQRVREEAEALGAIGLFFECLPDDPALYRDQSYLEQNRKRLAFYEKFGARLVAGTLYETPVKPEDDGPPYLVFDGLGKSDTIPLEPARKIVRAILERKYGDYCPADYIATVVESFRQDPVRLRSPRYTKSRETASFQTGFRERRKILLVVNDRNAVHHVRERGYVESPVRIRSILRELERSGLFRGRKVLEFPGRMILEVHDRGYFNYFKKVCRELPPGKSVYPYVFPLRNGARPPRELSVRAGYYCLDTFTPLNLSAYEAARWGVNCALTAAEEIASGARSAYVLTRPPGHHAERAVFGGFCYFNNCAIAAHYLTAAGRVAILDIDYHHGNGQQQIFYSRADVLTISLHGHPSFAYPYFSGFSEETGEGAGEGFNRNYPLPETMEYAMYEKTLQKALKLIRDFRPDFLIVALGLDTARGDPTGTWSFNYDNFANNGRMIGRMRLPLLVIQEGGYRTQSLGLNARAFFSGLHQAINSAIVF